MQGCITGGDVSGCQETTGSKSSAFPGERKGSRWVTGGGSTAGQHLLPGGTSRPFWRCIPGRPVYWACRWDIGPRGTMLGSWERSVAVTAQQH